LIISRLNLADYLLQQDLLKADDIVGGGLVIFELSSRQRNFIVKRKSHLGHFVKQANPIQPLSELTLFREAEFYKMMQMDQTFVRLSQSVPVLKAYDHDNKLLVLELLDDAETLASLQHRLGAYSEDHGRQLAHVLAELHRPSIFEAADLLKATQKTFQSVPWVLCLCGSSKEESYVPNNPSKAHSAILSFVTSNNQFSKCVSELHSCWSRSAVIHGDIKFDNVLSSSVPQGLIKVIDWELYDVGDPLWDVGSVLHSYLLSCLSRAIANPQTTLHAQSVTFSQNLAAARSAVLEFWRAYVEEAQIDDSSSSLIRAMNYCGARMLQTAYEASSGCDSLSSCAVYLLQVCSNVWRNPQCGAEVLFGLGELP
jgi:thiamine kinase-like enzyme